MPAPTISRVIDPEQDERFMRIALNSAEEARCLGEVPIGATLVHEGEVIARGFNRNIIDNDPTAHAEVVTLRKAGRKTQNQRLLDCDLYVTIEPCVMCAGAITHARVRRLIFGARDPKAGAVFS